MPYQPSDDSDDYKKEERPGWLSDPENEDEDKVVISGF